MRSYDLTEGNIPKKLLFLSVPIMCVMFMQCAFNVVDMFWLGKLGPESVAAVGSAGFYPWLAQSLILISRIGGEVKVSKSIGEKNEEKTKKYIKSVLELDIIHAIIFGLIVFFFSRNLMEVLNIKNEYVNSNGAMYLRVLSYAMIFAFLNPIFSSIFNGMGDSKTPFKINAFCIFLNIVLDPIFIFGLIGLPRMNVFGAALATILSQITGTALFLIVIIKNKIPHFRVKLFRNIDFKYYKILYKLGIPVGLQSGLFTIISMCVAIIVARFGPKAIAAQEIGIQIESISFMTAEGISTAMSAFIGQNLGAKNAKRIRTAIKIGIGFATSWGVFSLFIMIGLGTNIFSLFINDPVSVKIGTAYLIIFGLNQPFNCNEIITTGIFKGLGRTFYPATVSITLNALRIPMALLLVETSLGINGIWLAMSISSVLKGSFMLLALFIRYRKKTLYPGSELVV